MIVISDTSPLTNLAAIGQFALLQQLYVEIHIPDGVWHELKAEGKEWPGWREVVEASWVTHHAVKDQTLVTVLMEDLDRGEAEGIALALEMQANLILIDEKEGRHTAHRLGLQVVGVLGVLLQAKAKGLITRVRPLLDDLRAKADFYLSEALYQAVLTQAGEQDANGIQ